MKSDNRYLGALIIAPILIFIFLGGLPLKILTIILSILGMYEFYRAVRKKEFKPLDIIGYLMLVLYYVFSNRFDILAFIIILGTMLVLIVPVINLKYTFIDSAITVLGFIYVGVFFSFLYLVASKYNGAYYVWLIFIGSWITDTAAYYSGRLFGKTKLCPKVSPKKTVEGSIGGLVGAMIFSGIYGIIISNYTDTFAIYHFFIIGALCGILSQFGDLVASSVKRYVDVKDYSHLIPGHGGVLDRFDSILFSGIVVFTYLTLVIGL